MVRKKTSSRSRNLKSTKSSKSVTNKRTSSGNQKKRSGGNIGWLLLALTVIAGGIFAAVYIKGLYTTNFSEGIVIDGINVSGMSKEEANKIVEEAAQEQLDKISVTFRYNDKSWHFNAQELNATINIQSVIDKAYEEGRSDSVIERFKSQKDIKTMGRMLNSSIIIDEMVLVEALSDLKNEINQPMVDASIIFDPSNYDFFLDSDTPDVDMSKDMFTITAGKIGYAIDYDAAIQELNEALAVGWIADITITAELEHPQITAEMLEECTTLIYHSSSEISSKSRKNLNRNHNVGKAIGFYKGLVVMPGEILSYNELLGERTKKAGWKEAPIIDSDKTLVNQLGGGICQAASTVFNAAYMAGAKILESNPHSWRAYYHDFGFAMDAMVNYNYSDFVFQNNSDYPMFFNTYFWYSPSTKLPGYVDVDVYTMPQKDENGNRLYICAEPTEVRTESASPAIYLPYDVIANPYPDAEWTIDAARNEYVFERVKSRSLYEYSVDRVWYKDCTETEKGVWDDGIEVKREFSHNYLYKSITAEIYTKPVPVVETPTPAPSAEPTPSSDTTPTAEPTSDDEASG